MFTSKSFTSGSFSTSFTRFSTSVTKLMAVGLAGLVVIGTTACGDDADADADAGNPATTAVVEDVDEPATTTVAEDVGHSDHDVEHPEVMINGVDYAFQDVPETVPAGAKLGFQNLSATELHEMVVFSLPAGDDTPLSELITRPDLEAVLGAPVTVMLQPPGAPEPIVAVGDGILTEPGRYALMCFIPVGADPQQYMDAVAAAGGGKPEGVAGGPPHFISGMYAELVVE